MCEEKELMELRELDVKCIPRDVQIGVFGCRDCGVTSVAQTLVQKLECKNVCVVSKDTRGEHAEVFGDTHVVQTAAAPLYQQADSVIVDDMELDRSFMRALVPHEHGKLRILTGRSSGSYKPECRNNCDYIFLGRDISATEQNKRMRHFCPDTVPESKWRALVAATTMNPKARHRFLVIRPTFYAIHIRGIRPVWKRTMMTLKPCVRVSSLMHHGRSRFLNVDLASRLALMLPIADAVALYSINTALYNHISQHLARIPSYERRVTYPENVVLIETRVPPRYALPVRPAAVTQSSAPH
jgi:hypothetical protein